MILEKEKFFELIDMFELAIQIFLQSQSKFCFQKEFETKKNSKWAK